ncbi:MAG: carboxylesterase family protein, partial [Janthinobacterium lividum]
MHEHHQADHNCTRRAVLGAGASLLAGGAAAGPRRAHATPASPVVETSHGQLRGLTSDGVLVFKGVRYGESTGGVNRFRPPVPVLPWAGVRDATAFAHSAPQAQPEGGTLDAWYTAIEPTSED